MTSAHQQSQELNLGAYVKDLVSKKYGPDVDLEQMTVWQTVARFNERQNWATLMEVAPSALTSIAYCFAVAQLDGAENIQPSQNGPVTDDLRTSITLCYNNGLNAFKVAERAMRNISTSITNILNQSGHICMIQKNIAKAREVNKQNGNMDRVSKTLKDLVQKLMEDATKCSTESKSVFQKFESWSKLAADIELSFTNPRVPKQKEKNLQSGPLVTLATKRYGALVANDDTGIAILRACLHDLIIITNNLYHLETFFSDFEAELRDLHSDKVQSLADEVDFMGEDNDCFNVMENQILAIRLGYILVGAKADLYELASRQHLLQGVDLVTKLRLAHTPQSLEMQIQQIEQYSTNTKRALQGLVENDNVRDKLRKAIGSGEQNKA